MVCAPALEIWSVAVVFPGGLLSGGLEFSRVEGAFNDDRRRILAAVVRHGDALQVPEDIETGVFQVLQDRIVASLIFQGRLDAVLVQLAQFGIGRICFKLMLKTISVSLGRCLGSNARTVGTFASAATGTTSHIQCNALMEHSFR